MGHTHRGYGGIRLEKHRRVRRIPLKEAAAELGISKDAVRQRIRRGTLRSDKGEDDRVYVYLDPTTDAVHDDAPEERSEARDHDLVDELRDRVSYLERQVEEEREARRRADTLLARLVDRMPELEAAAEPPPDKPGSPETVEDRQESGKLRPDAPGPHSEATGLRKPWWRRVFGRD